MRVDRPFYDCGTIELAKKLLGTILCRRIKIGEDFVILKGRIVETEAYPGGDDKASHSYNGRRTPGNKPMYMEAGTCYVYFTYGMYHCFNISSGDEGGAVLLRALEPLDGINVMHLLRASKKKTPDAKKRKDLSDQELCSGPAKLCLALDINKDGVNMQDLTESHDIWIETGLQVSPEFLTSPRIGIGSVRDRFWVDIHYRFFLNCPFVSKSLSVQDSSSRSRKKIKR